jgi:DNA-binding NarL/FixJ family response regulator
VLLFVERARRVSSDFVLTPENQEAVALICRRLDGLPLALELAAAQVSFLPPATLLRRLDRALPLLVDGARDLPERQRTMRAAIEWSYKLLPPNERVLFERLAVFAGGFSLEAVEVVGADEQIDGLQVLRLLRRLVDQSLVLRNTVDGEVRYRMLEPIRQFAVEQLTTHGTAPTMHDRHASFFLALAEQAAPLLQSAQQVEWLAVLEREHSNLRAAMTWFLTKPDLDRASRLCWALWLFMWMRGHLAEGRRWVEQMLPQRAAAVPDVRGRILLAAMVIGFGQGAYAWAASFIDECLSLYQDLNDPLSLAHATSMAGLNYAGIQQYDTAEPMMDLGVQRYLAVSATWNAAMLLNFWSAIPRNRGDYVAAKRLTEQALALAQQHGDRVTMYSSLYNLASIAQAQGVYTDALYHFRAALALAVEIRDGGNMVSCLEGIAAVRAAQGDVASAAQLWGAAEALLERNEAAVYSYVPDRSHYAQFIDRARRLVPAERWSSLWNAGRTQRLDQTLVLAQHDESIVADYPSVPSDGLMIAETGEFLTPRELDVLRLIGQGLRNRMIAERLVISEKTVQNHISNIFAKLQVNDRSEAIIWASQRNLIEHKP